MPTRLQAAQAAYVAAVKTQERAYASADASLRACLAAHDEDDPELFAALEVVEERFGLPAANIAKRDAKRELVAAAKAQTEAMPEFAAMNTVKRHEVSAVFTSALRQPKTADKLITLCLRMA
jgi:secreted protein with Ig-like and vWFA domain